MDRACTAPRQDIKARPVPAAPEAARRAAICRREGRGAGTMRRSGLLNLVPRAQNRCVICAALVRAGAATARRALWPRGMSWRNRGKRAAGADMACRLLGNPYLHTRGFQHERRSNAVRHRRLDHRAMAGRLFRGRPARGAAGRPRRRAGRARRQCLDPAGRRPGAGAPAGRTGAAAGGGGRRPVAPAAVWRALRGQDNIDVAGWPTTAACPRSPTRPTRMPAWCGACAPPAPS